MVKSLPDICKNKALLNFLSLEADPLSSKLNVIDYNVVEQDDILARLFHEISIFMLPLNISWITSTSVAIDSSSCN